MKEPRVPGKRVVYVGGRPVVLTDAEYRALLGGKRKGKRLSAADRAWERLAKEMRPIKEATK